MSHVDIGRERSAVGAEAAGDGQEVLDGGAGVVAVRWQRCLAAREGASCCHCCCCWRSGREESSRHGGGKDKRGHDHADAEGGRCWHGGL